MMMRMLILSGTINDNILLSFLLYIDLTVVQHVQLVLTSRRQYALKRHFDQMMKNDRPSVLDCLGIDQLTVPLVKKGFVIGRLF